MRNYIHCQQTLTMKQSEKKLHDVKYEEFSITVLVNHLVNHRQETPLTLRGQRGCCRNIKGEPQIYGIFVSFLSLRPRHFSSSKPKLCTKFEVPSFSRCVNMEVKPHILRSSTSPRPPPHFLWVSFYDGLWQTQAVYQI